MRRFPFEVWFVGLVFFTHVYVFLLPTNSLLAWFSSDDAFYYFKTAQNITEGYGITFDRIGRASGFHPLWMLILTPVFALARFDVVLPLRLVMALSVLLTAGTGVFLYRIVKRVLHPYAAVFASVFWAFFPMIHKDVTELGMEAAISAFMVTWLIYRLAREEDAAGDDVKRWLVTGVIAALALMARLDNVFLVLIAGAWLAVRPVRMRYLLVADLALVGLGVLLSYFLRVGFGPQSEASAYSSFWMIAAALTARILLYYAFGLYNPTAPGLRGLLKQLGRAAAASSLASVFLAALMLGLFSAGMFPAFPRLVLVYEAVFGVGALFVTRCAAYLITREQVVPAETLQWRSTIIRAACYFAPVGVLLAAYMTANLWYFGTPSPVSGQIKRWWGTLPNTVYGRPASSVPEILGFFKEGGGPWWLAQELTAYPTWLPGWARWLIYGSFAAFLLVKMHRLQSLLTAVHALALFPLFIGGVIQLISYTGTGYLHMRNWYWISQMLFITLLLAVVLDAGVRWLSVARVPVLPPTVSRRTPAIVIALLCIGVAAAGMGDVILRMPAKISERQANRYMDDMEKLLQMSEPGSIIGSTGGGVIAYFVQDRTIVNLDGLMNTYEYYKLLKAGRASEYLDQIGLNYIYTVEYTITSSDPYFQFKGRLEPIDKFGGATLFIWK
jgi:hypothetical protein